MSVVSKLGGRRLEHSGTSGPQIRCRCGSRPRLRELGPEGRRLYDYNQFLASFHPDYFPFIPLKLASHAALRLLEGIDFDWISSKISGFVS